MKAGETFYFCMKLSGPVGLAATVERIDFIISVVLRPVGFPVQWPFRASTLRAQHKHGTTYSVTENIICLIR